MTQAEFYTALQKCHKANPFVLIEYGMIRQKKGESCPLCAVCQAETGKQFSDEYGCEAGAYLKLTLPFTNKVINGADNEPLPGARTVLLNALNLKELA